MIILYGGSFNPPTIAHFEIAKYLINKYHPNKFIFVPVGSYYEKDNIAPFRDRYNMLELIANKLASSYVTDFENTLDNYKGTLYTLNHFSNIYLNEEIYFVIGADNLLTIDTWINSEEILKRYKFIVLNRDKLDINKYINNKVSKYKCNFFIEDEFPMINVSATLYRDKHYDDVVLKEINEYIYSHNLYNRGVLNEK